MLDGRAAVVRTPSKISSARCRRGRFVLKLSKTKIVAIVIALAAAMALAWFSQANASTGPRAHIEPFAPGPPPAACTGDKKVCSQVIGALREDEIGHVTKAVYDNQGRLRRFRVDLTSTGRGYKYVAPGNYFTGGLYLNDSWDGQFDGGSVT